MNEIECETCIKRKTKYCPNSSECYETKEKPYYQNRIMLLEENQQLKEKLEASERARKKVIYHIKNNVEDYEFENTEHYVEILDILDIDKGE